MLQSIRRFFIGAAISGYLFPFGMYVFPEGFNTKNIMGLLGLVLMVYHGIQNRTFNVSKNLFGAFAFAILFSLVCLIATDINRTTDYSYATYIVSFTIWTCGGYAVCSLIRYEHGQANIKLITFYLAGICFAQCVLALLIDRISPFQLLVDTYISQGQEFLNDIDRLYGIGASLDPAGVRFSVVLILIATVLGIHPEVKSQKKVLIPLLLSYFVILIVGNMISRTTTTGFAISLLLLIYATGLFQFVIRTSNFKLFRIFFILVIPLAILATLIYQSDPAFRESLRFGFEGFFNFFETGTWRTGSTDKLNDEMWIWPTTLKGWIIGTGLFDGWVYGTDVGYCRFILYSGLIGIGTFSLLFLYCAVVFARAYPKYRILFLFLFVYTFVVWIKVSTDIYFIYAIFFAMDKELFNYRTKSGELVPVAY